MKEEYVIYFDFYFSKIIDYKIVYKDKVLVKPLTK